MFVEGGGVIEIIEGKNQLMINQHYMYISKAAVTCVLTIAIT